MAPLLPVGFRRQGRMMLYTPLLLLDTAPMEQSFRDITPSSSDLPTRI
jgi:hypothetical protein